MHVGLTRNRVCTGPVVYCRNRGHWDGQVRIADRMMCQNLVIRPLARTQNVLNSIRP
jgi:hypothetical protein